MMNNELRPYDNYKSIDLPWLNSIPEHWSVSRNKNMMFQAKSLVGGNHHNYKLLSLTLNGVIARDMVNPKGKFPKEFDTYQIVNQEDLVFCLFDIDETPRTVGISPLEGMITGAYTVFNVKNANERYLYYYYLALDNNKMLKPLYTGLRKVISADTFLRTKLPIPPRPEQDQIVKCLDHQLAKINKFIKAKKKELVLIRELIDSETNRTINCDSTKSYRLINTVNLVGEEINRVNDKEYIPIGLYNRGRGLFHKAITMGVDLGDSSFFKVGDDYLIFSGQFAWEGAVAITTLDDVGCIASHRYPMVKGKTDMLSSKYLWAFFVSKYGDHLLNLNSRGAAGRNRPLNINYLLKETIPVPTMENQLKISRLVEQYHALRNEIFKYVDLLSEYKNSLISDVVTGKVDVRNIVIEELEEEIIGDIELDEDSIDDEVLEEEDGDE